MSDWKLQKRLPIVFVCCMSLSLGLVGCHGSNSRQSPPSKPMGKRTDNIQDMSESNHMVQSDRHLDEAEAIKIVERHVRKETNGELIPVCEVEKLENGFKVFVQYGTQRDSMGNVTGFFPGGHAIYVLSREGKIEHVIGGN